MFILDTHWLWMRGMGLAKPGQIEIGSPQSEVIAALKGESKVAWMNV